MDTRVEAGEICVRCNKNDDFSNHEQSYADDTDFVGISEKLDNFLAGEIDLTATCTDIICDTLKPSQKIAHDVIVQDAVQPEGTSCTENANYFIFV